MEKLKQHDWQPNEDILAYYLYRIECERGNDKQISFEAALEYMLAQYRNDSNFAKREKSLRGSLKARISDFKDLAGKNLTHNSSKSERVYHEYKNMDIKDHRKKCLEILGL